MLKFGDFSLKNENIKILILKSILLVTRTNISKNEPNRTIWWWVVTFFVIFHKSRFSAWDADFSVKILHISLNFHFFAFFGPRNFSGGTYDFSPVCPFVRNAFSPSLMSQIFWNLVYSLSGVKVRECPSLFLIFANFGPGGPKNSHFWPFFGHFRIFSDFKIFLVNKIFSFFNMMFLGMFRSQGGACRHRIQLLKSANIALVNYLS